LEILIDLARECTLYPPSELGILSVKALGMAFGIVWFEIYIQLKFLMHPATECIADLPADFRMLSAKYPSHQSIDILNISRNLKTSPNAT
jgi:hypothetical protein